MRLQREKYCGRKEERVAHREAAESILRMRAGEVLAQRRGTEGEVLAQKQLKRGAGTEKSAQSDGTGPDLCDVFYTIKIWYQRIN